MMNTAKKIIGKAPRKMKTLGKIKPNLTMFWQQSEKRLMEWLSYELHENPHLERVLTRHYRQAAARTEDAHLISPRTPIFSEMWY